MVKLQNCFYIQDSRELFTFKHPNFPKNEVASKLFPSKIDNSRYASVSFVVEEEHCTCHGFSCTFDSLLFDQTSISIVPPCPNTVKPVPCTHPRVPPTPAMFSWFPIFLPLLQPISLSAGDVVTVDIWRYAPMYLYYSLNLFGTM